MLHLLLSTRVEPAEVTHHCINRIRNRFRLFGRARVELLIELLGGDLMNHFNS